MQLADEIIGQHGISGNNSGSSSTATQSSVPTMESRNTSFSDLPVAEKLPDISDGQRDIFLERAMGKTPKAAMPKPKEAPVKRAPTNEELEILKLASRILEETTFAGALGVNMGGSSSYETNPPKSKKKKTKKKTKGIMVRKKGLHSLFSEAHVIQGTPPSEFGRTFDNAWRPYSNSIAGKPQSLDKLAKGVLKRFKK